MTNPVKRFALVLATWIASDPTATAPVEMLLPDVELAAWILTLMWVGVLVIALVTLL